MLAAVALADDHFDHVWVSPKLRAQQTAAPFLELTGRRCETLDYLEEIYNPAWEGTDHDAMEIFAAHRRRNPSEQWHGLDGGESVTDFHTRVTSGIDQSLAELGVVRSADQLPTWSEATDITVLVFAHAGTNSVALTHLLGVEPVPWEWERFVTGHASISEVRTIGIGPVSAFSMTKLSSTRHLPDHLLTR